MIEKVEFRPSARVATLYGCAVALCGYHAFGTTTDYMYVNAPPLSHCMGAGGDRLAS